MALGRPLELQLELLLYILIFFFFFYQIVLRHLGTFFSPLWSRIAVSVPKDSFSCFVTVLLLTFLRSGSVVGQHAPALASPGALASFQHSSHSVVASRLGHSAPDGWTIGQVKSSAKVRTSG